jgi:hypothetical protein
VLHSKSPGREAKRFIDKTAPTDHTLVSTRVAWGQRAMKATERRIRRAVFLVALPLLLFLLHCGRDEGNANRPAGPSAPPTEKEKIARLLDMLEKSEGLTFIRNDAEYPSAAARKWMEYKLAKTTETITTANDFIDKIATHSKQTGQPYLVRLPDGRTTESVHWLRARLAQIERTTR